MPLPPANLPYDTAETALNMARIFLGDYIQGSGSIVGDIFSDAQPYTLPTLNLAWRRLQKYLADENHPRLENEVDIIALPVAGSQDPITQQWINWAQFFDGANYTTTPVLPQDFISPKRLWERVSGTIENMRPMHPVVDGLPSVAKPTYNHWWDWREDAIYLIGSVISMDLRIRYAAYLPDIVPAAMGGLAATPLPIMRCAEAVAYYCAATFIDPRGNDPKAADFFAKGNDAADNLVNQESKRQQRMSVRRRLGVGRRGPGMSARYW